MRICSIGIIFPYSLQRTSKIILSWRISCIRSRKVFSASVRQFSLMPLKEARALQSALQDIRKMISEWVQGLGFRVSSCTLHSSLIICLLGKRRLNRLSG